MRYPRILIACILAACTIACAAPTALAQTCPPPLGDAPSVLRSQYRPVRVLSYSEGRDTLYAKWAAARRGTIRTVYTGLEVPLTQGDPTQVLYRQGVNTEHSWPRSRGADGYPAEADLHILFPSDERTNSRRGNLPYGTVPDDEVVAWSVNGDRFRGRPDDEYVSRVGTDAFEPPDPVKGDLARAHLYFALVYPENVDTAFFSSELPDLLRWHLQDPPSRDELLRDSVIQAIQGNCNPFVRWPGLAHLWMHGGDLSGVCAEFGALVEPFGMESVVYEDLDSCELMAVGATDEVLLTGDPAETVRAWFRTTLWNEDLTRAADGPGTTSFVYARADYVCEVSGGAPSYLEDGEIIVADEYELNFACHRGGESDR